MCGRYNLKITSPELAVFFDLPEGSADLPARYNIAPTQAVPIVRVDPEVGRHLVLVRWGFVPAWAKEMTGSAPLINARLETAAEKPTFRQSFKNRRCLIPANGFYEWHRAEAVKQPYHFHLPDHGLVAFAGLWDRWQAPDGSVIDSCAMLTTEANAVMAPIHHRVPVFVELEHFGTWLDPREQNGDVLRHALQSSVADRLVATPVSRRVNQVVNDDEGLLAEATVETAPRELTLFD